MGVIGRGKFDLDNVPGPELISGWQQKMNSFGARLTGTKAHKQFIDFLEAELTRAGLTVFRDRYRFRKWEAKRWSLSVRDADGTVHELPTTFYYPYSGETSPEGVTAELVYCGQVPGSFEDAAGKIAIVDMPAMSVPFSSVFSPRASYPHGSITPPSEIDNPLLNTITNLPDLHGAAQQQVLGVLYVWTAISEDLAADQYLPFLFPDHKCPALWVSAQTGARLRDLAGRHAHATLTLEATCDDDATTDTVYAVLPGHDERESIIVNTHSDGPNALEENGTIGLLALAHAFAKVPLAERRRSLVFVFATGHFQLTQFLADGSLQVTSKWLKDHPEWWDGQDGHKAAVAAVTLEHLGCTEWSEDREHTSYGPTAEMEIEFVYTSNATMENIYANALRGRTKVRSITVAPPQQPDHHYLGEGQPLFQKGIPTISLIPLPTYVCSALVDGGIARVDIELMHQQIQTFAKVIAEIDSTPSITLATKVR